MDGDQDQYTFKMYTYLVKMTSEIHIQYLIDIV